MFQRLWTRTTAVLAASLCVVFGPGCRPTQPGETREVLPELKLEGVRFRVWRGADLRAKGEAQQASLRRDSTELVAHDLAAVLPRGSEPVRLTAPEGQGVLSDRVFSARGGVTVGRADDLARTPSARFEPGPAGGTVLGEEQVEVTGRGYRLDGTGFTLEPASGDLTLGGPARLVAGLPEAR
jgi:lipopolysaccharide export system protein LptC